MLKKSLLSLSVTASLAVLAGCNISSTTDNAGATPAAQTVALENAAAVEAQDANVVTPVFDPIAKALPLGIDFIFAAQASSSVETSKKDGTADSGAEFSVNESPVTDALDDLDGGISTLAPIDIPMTGTVDEATVTAGTSVRLIKLPNASDIAAYNLILPNGVTAADIDALDLSTLGNFFSQLKQDNTAPANATETVAYRNLFGSTFDGSNPATITDGMIAMQPVAGVDYEVNVISFDDGNDNVIRINPLKPLAAKTKYIVVLTGDITGTDADSTPIQASRRYKYVNGSDDLFTAALAGVRASVQGWESMAGAIITSGGSNLAPLAGGIALTAGFTTVDPKTVLKSMAYPGFWAQSAVAENDPTVAAGLIATAVGAGLTTQTIADGVKAAAQSKGLTADEATVFTAGYLLSGALTTDAGNGIAYQSPRAREYEMIKNVTLAPSVTVNQAPLVALSSATSAVGGDKVLVSQGAIELPQYTTTLTDVNQVASWEANSAVGAVLDSIAGNAAGTTPPSDINGSKNVTYRYPFAKQQRTTVAPLLFIEPTVAAKATALTALGATDSGCTKPGTGWPVVISQHGFTVNRAGTLLMGAQLAQNTCSVVVAMDLPHHGIAPLSTDRNGDDITNSTLGLTVTYNADTAAIAPFASAVNAIVTATPESLLANLQERHEGLYLSGASVLPMTWGDTKAGKSGDLYIQLTNFQRSRDNNRQAVLDLLNLNATLATIDIDGDDVADLDTTNVSYVGHSLGAITGTMFVAVNNDATVQIASDIPNILSGGALKPTLPKIQSVVLATPGGGITKMLENSVSIGPSILGGLSIAAGIQQGDSNFESFMKVLQATLDSSDPMNFISDLATGGSSTTPTMLVEMIGGGTISGADLAADTLPESLETLGVYPADLVIPNSTTAATQETARMPLSGTEPMITLLGSTEITAAGANQVQSYPVTKFNQGTHGTFSSVDSAAVFTEMVTQAATFVGSSGAVITVADDSVIDVAP